MQSLGEDVANMSQYKDFAAIYDELIHSDIDYEAWSQVILDICNEEKMDKRDYLDLACGTGNLTERLGRHFRSVWAVDISDQMLTEAETKLRTNGIKAKLVCQDISSLKLNQKFDLATCCLDSVNYITEKAELGSFFKAVFNHLKDNGLLIFDMNSYYKLTEILGNNLYTYDEDDVVYIWENSLENDLLNMNLTFFVREGNLYRRFDEEHLERAYKEEYIDRLVEEIGFKIVKKLNNYEHNPIDKECERIVYILKK